MFNFDGEYRRRREQNLSGASKLSGVNELITRAQNERIRRRLDKRRELSAITIQCVFRGYLCRLRLKRRWAMEFLELLHKLRFRLADLSDIKFLVPRMHIVGQKYFSRSHLDAVMRAAIILSNDLLQLASQSKIWMWRVTVILGLTVKVIEECEMETSTLQILLLACETLDKFTKIHDNLMSTCKIIIRLAEQNYMIVIRDLAVKLHNYKINYNYLSFEINELYSYALELLRRPFQHINEINNPKYMTAVLFNFTEMIFVDSVISNAIKDCIIPALCAVENFPVRETIDAFMRCEDTYNVPIALYFFLLFDDNQQAIPAELQPHYMTILAKLTENLYRIVQIRPHTEEEQNVIELNGFYCTEILNSCLKLLNTSERSKVWCNTIEEALIVKDHKTIIAHCKCMMHLLILNSECLYRFKIFNDIWTINGWLRGLWVVLESQVRIHYDLPVEGSLNILAVLKRGSLPTQEETSTVIPLISVFTHFLFTFLSFTSDSDIMSGDLISNKGVLIKPFTVKELIYIISTMKDVAVGLLLLGFPESGNLCDPNSYIRSPTNNKIYNAIIWHEALTGSMKLVREFYMRNDRCHFTNVSHWYCFLIAIPDTGIQNYVSLHNAVKKYQPFNVPNPPRKLEESIGVWYDRAISLLTNLPFTLPFVKRHKILWNVLRTEIGEHQSSEATFGQIPSIASIRRHYIYEDAFSKFTVENEPEMRIAIRIRFTSSLNVDEIGVDGGGIFREFICDLLKTAFDPNRGFFALTKENKLYPNPDVKSVYPDYEAHYFFIGRMLGKAIFENVVVDIPLADFFLALILNPEGLYPSLLHTLDLDIFKNVSFLRSYEDDYANLGLDFTLTTNNFGMQTVTELVQNGSEIPVTSDNVREYIQLVAKQKLHLDIFSQTRAFIKGLMDILPLHIIRMFTPQEFQHIISGSHCPIDLNDMKKNVVYTGGFSPNHPTIKIFWRVLESFSDQERKQLLQFVTSCSRPPLRGFQDFYPPFCIQLADGIDSRLPTSSTCMNILKLPLFTDDETMREKLIYAIQAGAGFELT